jgi:hypothetical protein
LCEKLGQEAAQRVLLVNPSVLGIREEELGKKVGSQATYTPLCAASWDEVAA